MASYIGSTLTSNARTNANGSTRVCPDCGGLECLCRPRFFAGQLLTEQEFNRLDHYIVEKNKLRNRYLHGWGVVCGLDVVCDGCGGGVVVKTGYALSPCGEDIVVCRDTPVDICTLINQCQKKTQSNCGAPNANDGCVEATQEWVLGVRYTETASRGVMPLRGGSSSNCGCGCGGNSGKSASGGCGCGGSSTASNSRSSSASSGCGCGQKQGGGSSSSTKCAPPLQCEPTVLCEGYSFCVYPAPTRKTIRDDKSATAKGALPARFNACYQNLLDVIPAKPDTQASQQELHDWIYAVKSGLQAYVRDNAVYDCQLTHKIGEVICPSVNLSDDDFQTAFATAGEQLLLIILELTLACMCRALQPPCPDPVTDDCVPLAVITVQNNDTCKVRSICNWTTLRKYVTTVPNIQYWLSILPFGRMLREALERFCCEAITQFMPEKKSPVNHSLNHIEITNENVEIDGQKAKMKTEMNTEAKTEPVSGMSGMSGISMHDGSPSTAFRASSQTVARSKAFIQMALQTLSSSDSMDAASLALGLLGEENSDHQSYLTAEQSDNPIQFLMLDQMVKPVMRTMMVNDRDKNPMLENLASMFSGGAASSADDRVQRSTVGASRSTQDAEQDTASAGSKASITKRDVEQTKRGTASQAMSSADFEARFKTLSDTVQKQQAMIDQLNAQLKVQSDVPSQVQPKVRAKVRKSPKKKNG